MGRAVNNVAFALLCVLCYCTACIAVKFTDCGSTLGQFTNVSVTNCHASDQKCNLIRGTNVTIFITFIPNKDISKVNVRVYGVLMDIAIPFPVDKPDVCKDPDCGVQCPLHTNQKYYYTTTMVVQRKFPSVSVDIKWEFVDEKEDKIVCVIFPAKIKG